MDFVLQRDWIEFFCIKSQRDEFDANIDKQAGPGELSSQWYRDDFIVLHSIVIFPSTQLLDEYYHKTDTEMCKKKRAINNMWRKEERICVVQSG